MPLSDRSTGQSDGQSHESPANARSGTDLTQAAWSTTVAERVIDVRQRIEAARQRGGHGQDVVLVAVTKTHGIEAVQAAYDAGVHDVGENRVQEAEPKMLHCTLPVHWHLIGHLQRNKARAAVNFHLVHSLDSERLAAALDRAAQDASEEAKRVVDVLVQVNVSGETTKSGVSAGELPMLADKLHAFTGLRVRGAMTMAPFDADDRTLRTVFSGARRARGVLESAGHPASLLSMGMSGDFEVAIEEGATHVRLGTILFGTRS